MMEEQNTEGGSCCTHAAHKKYGVLKDRRGTGFKIFFLNNFGDSTEVSTLLEEHQCTMGEAYILGPLLQEIYHHKGQWHKPRQASEFLKILCLSE